MNEIPPCRGIANDGFWGIPVKPDTTYKASFYAKAEGLTGPLTVAIESTDGNTTYATATVAGITGSWKKYEVELKTGPNVKASSGFETIPAPAGAAPPPGARGRGGDNRSGRVLTHFTITSASAGTVWFNLVSLFPPTYKNRPNGMRPDLMQLLADMKPAFLRFPGGNYLEGNRYEDRFDWKRTLGPLEDRPGHTGTWGANGLNYRSSDGVGLLEFLNWCEDLNIEPVVGVYAGLSLGGQTIQTGPALDISIQEALEEIEYVTGDASTVWGARRAKDGHPAPFKLNYVEVGNEDNLSQGGPSYNERYSRIYKAIKTKYPQIKVIASARNLVQDVVPDIEDSHHYMNAGNAITTSRMFDTGGRGLRSGQRTLRDAGAPKIFIGEYATRIGSPTPTFQAALYDAVFLTGMERSADIVIMTGYAPLFVNVNPPYPQFPGVAGSPNYPNGMQWTTDLIGYDTLSSFGSTSYYVQKMFSHNRGDTVLPMNVTSENVHGCASRDDKTGEVILKLVNMADNPAPLDIELAGVAAVENAATGWIFTGEMNDMNSIAEPLKISPKEIKIENAANKFAYQQPARSVVVLRVKAK